MWVQIMQGTVSKRHCRHCLHTLRTSPSEPLWKHLFPKGRTCLRAFCGSWNLKHLHGVGPKWRRINTSLDWPSTWWEAVLSYMTMRSLCPMVGITLGCLWQDWAPVSHSSDLIDITMHWLPYLPVVPPLTPLTLLPVVTSWLIIGFHIFMLKFAFGIIQCNVSSLR